MAIKNAFNKKKSTTMNKLYKFTCMMLTGLALLTTASCSDPDDEITTTDFDRLLRPSELELKIFDKTNIKATMDFVNVPDYLDILIEVNENPLSENKVFKEFRRETLQPRDFLGSMKDATLSSATTHATFIDSIRNLSYFKDYRVSFTARDADGKVSKQSTEVATTDGIFKESTDDDRTNTSLTVRWPSEVAVTLLRTMRMNGDTEELVAEDIIEDATKGKFIKTGLDPNTEYIFYIYNGEDCQGRTTNTTFPNYIEYTAQDGFDFQTAIESLADGYAIMLSPAGDGTKEFNLTSSTINISKNVRIMARNTQPVIVNKAAFNLNGATGLSLENISFADVEKKLALLKFTNATGDYKVSNVEVIGYKNFAQDPGSNACDVNELLVEKCFMHDGIGGRWMDFQKKMCYIKTITITQNTFANIANAQDFMRYDYYADHMPNIVLENNSFYKVNASSKGIMYIRSNTAGDKAFKCDINKNIFENCKDTYFSEDKKTDALTFSKNYYKNAEGLITPFAAENEAYDHSPNTFTGTSAFKNPDKNDFTISNTTLINAGVGNTEFIVKE